MPLIATKSDRGSFSINITLPYISAALRKTRILKSLLSINKFTAKSKELIKKWSKVG